MVPASTALLRHLVLSSMAMTIPKSGRVNRKVTGERLAMIFSFYLAHQERVINALTDSQVSFEPVTATEVIGIMQDADFKTKFVHASYYNVPTDWFEERLAEAKCNMV